MNLSTYTHIYFLGIGGIGMSALARWFTANGYAVAGYDRTPTPLTDELQREGIAIHFDDDVAHIPTDFQNAATTLVVYTPAVPADHRELNFFREQNFSVQKRSRVLGWLTQNQYTIAVAGTHGKTTTSSIIAHILKASGKNCAAFLGGITQNYGTNLLLNDPASAEPPIVVVEADEYDRSFLTLYPDVAVVNSLDADHLDIYGSADAVQTSYNEFVQQVKPGGKLIAKHGLPLTPPAGQLRTTVYFSRTAPADFRAENIRIENTAFVFDIVSAGIRIPDVPLYLPGFHNVENALAAAAAALHAGIAPNDIKNAIATYTGVKRRFDYIIKSEYLVFIDDYAHHPAEIEALLTSVRALYPDKKISAVFQPHLYSRTRDFAAEFARSLSLADRLFLLDIYPARELPITGVTSELIFDQVTIADKVRCTKNNLLEQLNNSSVEVLLTIGAGDIDQYVEPIKMLFRSKLTH